MKMCAVCGANVGVDVQTCPFDGEASWMATVEQVSVMEMLEAMPTLEEVSPEPKRGPGRPKKVSS